MGSPSNRGEKCRANEKRIYRKIKDISLLKEHEWPGLRCVSSIERVVNVFGHHSEETSFYTFNRKASAEQLSHAPDEHLAQSEVNERLKVEYAQEQFYSIALFTDMLPVFQ